VCGTVSAMLLANMLGILFGMYVGRKIPSDIFKFCSSALFLFFGIFSLAL
jgi:putative Ca2+/H+ antiporter (TMEM165/GDT1 family)